VVITASLSLADIPATARLWRQRKAEFLLSIAAFLGVALLGVLAGDEMFARGRDERMDYLDRLADA
jgi:hypothetical protein